MRPVVDTIKRWSRQGTIRIIEDAAYRELRYAGDDVPSLRSYDPEGDTVILTETFSKSFSPGIRVGWGFLPRDSDRTGREPEGQHRFRLAQSQPTC